MTVIVAVKDEGKTYLAADTATDCGNMRYIDKEKLWKINPYVAVGMAGDGHVLSYIRHYTEFEWSLRPIGPFTESWIFRNMLLPMRTAAEAAYTAKDKEEDKCPEILIAAGPELFVIAPDWCLITCTRDYMAIGEGAQAALGWLWGQSELLPEVQAYRAVGAAGNCCPSVSYGSSIEMVIEH